MRSLHAGILFDVDGTLVDTNYLHTSAWSRALRDVGQWAPMNAIHRLVGMGGDQLIPALLGRDCPEASAALANRYRELLEDVRAFPAASDLLRQLHARGLAVVLATSSRADELAAVLRQLDAGDVIDAQTTADDVRESKPAPEVFLTAMGSCGADGRHDLASATASGTFKLLAPPASAAYRRDRRLQPTRAQRGRLPAGLP
jgi:beta-phosphoglucomutase-like phosphatase (HAD superfamily)